MNRRVDVATSLLASSARLGMGVIVGKLGARPDKLLELYETEASPYCRKVREALSILDLEAMIYPCPREGKRFRPLVQERGGKLQFPWFVDPNSGLSLYESDDIVQYLFRVYGDGDVPLLLRLGPLTNASAISASAWRVLRVRLQNPWNCGVSKRHRIVVSCVKSCPFSRFRIGCTTLRRAVQTAKRSWLVVVA